MTNWTQPYTTSGNYTISDSDKLEVTGGYAQLKNSLTNIYQRLHCNESSGLSAADDSGNNRDMILQHSGFISGKLNNCVNLPGNGILYTNDKAVCGFAQADEFTFTTWAKFTSFTGTIVAKTNNSSKGYYVLDNADGTVVFKIFSPTGTLVKTSTTVLIADTWYHLAFSYKDSVIKIYINGSLDTGTDTNTGTLGEFEDTTSFYIIGGFSDDSYWMTGQQDEIVVYDKELSLSEIQFLYNSGTGREDSFYYTDSPNLYPTDDLSGVGTINTFDSFSETLGGGNAGTRGYNITNDNGSTWYYWNGSSWVSGGNSSNYNTTATVNTNISSFSNPNDRFNYRVFLISDGTQALELDENSLGYTLGQPPSVNAGTNKTCDDGATESPFSDCSFSDPDGTITAAKYKIDGEVDTWTSISQGGYGTLLEAVQAWEYTFDNTGTLTCQLQVTDNDGLTSDDSMTMTVSQITVTFNVKDYNDNHIQQLSFDPGDGGGWITKDSPFTHDYDKDTYTATFDKADLQPSTTEMVLTEDVTENITLNPQVLPSAIADAVWDEIATGHTTTNSTGDYLRKILFFSGQMNFRILDPAFNADGKMTSATVKIYANSTDLGNDTSALISATVTATFDDDGNMTGYRSTS